MFDYGEFCPISLATSALCERWTLQIVREMLLGATRFSEFQKHMPRLSPSLLKTRLRFLEEEGILFRKRMDGQRGYEYHLTAKGKAIEPILSALGQWGMYWQHEGLGDVALNAHTLMRDIAAGIDRDYLPAGDILIQVNFEDLEEDGRQFIRLGDQDREVCCVETGHEVDIYITGTLHTLTAVWYGDTTLDAARERGELKIVGAPPYLRHVARWFPISGYTRHNRLFLEATGRRAAGR